MPVECERARPLHPQPRIPDTQSLKSPEYLPGSGFRRYALIFLARLRQRSAKMCVKLFRDGFVAFPRRKGKTQPTGDTFKKTSCLRHQDANAMRGDGGSGVWFHRCPECGNSFLRPELEFLYNVWAIEVSTATDSR